ncbi:hypothetical protein HZH68_007230 [Vespula germanica]|uniref:Uncharacterized protein n=1 Tax=Vespula germanica TaxID=30212 RepID=A0A834K7P6_VESGE|nr:hypothetical protein HZH68_007230 [Vespula germanica]
MEEKEEEKEIKGVEEIEGRTVGRKGKDPKSITRVPVKGPALPLEKVTKVASGDLNGKQDVSKFDLRRQIAKYGSEEASVEKRQGLDKDALNGISRKVGEQEPITLTVPLLLLLLLLLQLLLHLE